MRTYCYNGFTPLLCFALPRHRGGDQVCFGSRVSIATWRTQIHLSLTPHQTKHHRNVSLNSTSSLCPTYVVKATETSENRARDANDIKHIERCTPMRNKNHSVPCDDICSALAASSNNHEGIQTFDRRPWSLCKCPAHDAGAVPFVEAVETTRIVRTKGLSATTRRRGESPGDQNSKFPVSRIVCCRQLMPDGISICDLCAEKTKQVPPGYVSVLFVGAGVRFCDLSLPCLIPSPSLTWNSMWSASCSTSTPPPSDTHVLRILCP